MGVTVPSRTIDRRVTALMTAESIIVGFLGAYATLVNSTLVYWSERGGQIFTTVFAGLLIYAMMLTAFRSIHLLFKSIDTSDTNNREYKAGYDLFLIVLLGSGIYVLTNAVSVVHFSMTGANVPVLDERLPNSIAGSFFVAWVLLVVFKPLELTEYVRSRLGFMILVALACVMIGVEVVILPLLSGLLSSYLWSVVFVAALTIAVVVLIFGSATD